MNNFDVIVVGGGASGLMCALTAGQRGRRVLVVDHNADLGKKILMSGGGHCNFTNLFVDSDHYISANPHFCKSALKRYTPMDFIDMMKKHGITYHERKHGELFCDGPSKDIFDMLIRECEDASVNFSMGCEINR